MTVHVLPRPTAVSLLPELTEASDALDRLHALPVARVPTSELGDVTAGGLAQLEARVVSLRLEVLA